MKYINLQFFKNHWPKILSVFFFAILFTAYVNSFAVFAPGETLNPNCAPGVAGCTVSSSGGTSIPDQTGNSGKYLTTDGTGNLSWNTGTGSSPWLTNGTSNYYNAGNVGIGTITPGYKLHVFVPGQASTNTPVDVMAVEVGSATSGSLDGYGPSILFKDSPGTKVVNMARISSVYEFNGANYAGALSLSTNPDTSNVNALPIERMRITNDGKIGIGLTSPTAFLNIKASTGTTGTAPLKFTSGSLLGTTEAGAVEYDGSHLYFTATNSGTRYQLDQQGGGGLTSDADFNTKGGTNAGLNLVAGAQYNTFLGYGAGKSASVGGTSSAAGNTAIGYQSLYSNTTGSGNTANGIYSLNSNTSGSDNIAIGYSSLVSNLSGTFNSAVGNFTLQGNITGSNSTANGYYSLYLSTGSGNTANGSQSLSGITTGYQNTALGYLSGDYIANGVNQNGTSNNSLYLGYDTRALADGDTNELVIGASTIGKGSNTVTIGNTSNLRTYLTGVNLKAGTNTAGTAPLKFTSGSLLGTTEAGAVEYDGSHLYFTATNGGSRYQLDQQGAGGISLTTTGSSGAATLVGSVLNIPQYTAGTGLSSDGDFNTKGGNSAGLNLVAGTQDNTFLGYWAGKGGPGNTGGANTATGAFSLTTNTTGSYNSIYGINSSGFNTTGSYNTATGANSLAGNPGTGSYNTASGYFSLNVNSSGYNNTAIGSNSLENNSVGYNNTAIGFESGKFITGGITSNASSNNSLYLGSNTKANASGDTNEIVIGYNATGNGNNTTTIGNSSILRTYLTGLNLKAGSTTAGTAPLKFTSGTVLGTTEAGAVEYDGSHLYFTATNGGTRYQLDQQAGGGGLTSDADFNTKGGTNAGLNLISGAQNNTFLGYEAGKGGVVTSVADNNIGIGYQPLYLNTGGYQDIAIGNSSLYSNTTGYQNVAVGYSALNANTTGYQNVAIGQQALQTNTTGNNSIAIGSAALSNSNGSYNLALGSGALLFNNGNNRNTAIGYQSMLYADSRSTGINTFNTAIGYEALRGSTTAANNTGINNTAIGDSSMRGNTSGYENTALGVGTLFSNTIGSGSIAIGYNALYSNTSGSGNIAIGDNAMNVNTAGASNVAIGNSALQNNTGGYNVAVGASASYAASAGTAQMNTAVGYQALYNNTSYSNTGIGYEALQNNSSGRRNVGVGATSLFSNGIATDNTATGFETLYVNTGSYNTAFGSDSLAANTTGANNTALGYNSGRYITGGSTANTISSNSLYIGNNTRASADGNTNEIVIGYGVTGNGNNTTTIGTGNVLYVGSTSIATNSLVARFTNNSGSCDITPVTGGVSCSSDINLKKNISTLEGNKDFVLQTIPVLPVQQTTLDKIMEITPVNYNWKNENNTDPKHIGFIAQEMEQIFPSIVLTDANTGLKSISYASITPYLVQGIQEMNLQIKDLESLDTTKATSLGSLITSFLSSATNNINLVFFGEVHAKKLCLDDVCITKEELQQILNHTNMTASAGGASVEPAPVSTPSETPVVTNLVPVETTPPAVPTGESPDAASVDSAPSTSQPTAQ